MLQVAYNEGQDQVRPTLFAYTQMNRKMAATQTQILREAVYLDTAQH